MTRTNSVRLKPATFILLFCIASILAATQRVYADVKYETLDWTDLIPPIDLAALEGQTIDHGDVPEFDEPSSGNESAEQGGFEPSFEEQAYQSALVSTRTVDTFNGKPVKLPGFIVPLEFDEAMTVTQFFLVPYFGACIHMPPPPPNQMVLVDYPEGIKLDALYDPLWISGELSIQVIENELGTSAYAMKMDSFDVYQ